MGFFFKRKRKKKTARKHFIFFKKAKKKKTVEKQPIVIHREWSPRFKAIVQSANRLGTDLVEMTEHHPTCAECAKYQGRVYSLTGRSLLYPKIPQVIIDKGYICKGCRHEFYPFVQGLSTPVHHKNIVSYSNSPFIDNRSPEEAAQWELKQQQIKEKNQDEREYKRICEKLPELAPKSFAGYRKMKNANSKNYQKLVQECEKARIKITEHNFEE